MLEISLTVDKCLIHELIFLIKRLGVLINYSKTFNWIFCLMISTCTSAAVFVMINDNDTIYMVIQDQGFLRRCTFTCSMTKSQNHLSHHFTEP